MNVSLLFVVGKQEKRSGHEFPMRVSWAGRMVMIRGAIIILAPWPGYRFRFDTACASPSSSSGVLVSATEDQSRKRIQGGRRDSKAPWSVTRVDAIVPIGEYPVLGNLAAAARSRLSTIPAADSRGLAVLTLGQMTDVFPVGESILVILSESALNSVRDREPLRAVPEGPADTGGARRGGWGHQEWDAANTVAFISTRCKRGVVLTTAQESCRSFWKPGETECEPSHDPRGRRAYPLPLLSRLRSGI